MWQWALTWHLAQDLGALRRVDYSDDVVLQHKAVRNHARNVLDRSCDGLIAAGLLTIQAQRCLCTAHCCHQVPRRHHSASLRLLQLPSGDPSWPPLQLPCACYHPHLCSASATSPELSSIKLAKSIPEQRSRSLTKFDVQDMLIVAGQVWVITPPGVCNATAGPPPVQGIESMCTALAVLQAHAKDSSSDMAPVPLCQEHTLKTCCFWLDLGPSACAAMSQ